MATDYAAHGATAEYQRRLAETTELARRSHLGQFGPPCGPALSDSGSSETDVYVDRPHVPNLPDGSLTGGFCRKKWWC